jgi:four helix bundle protein
MRENVLLGKSLSFAARILKLNKHLNKEKKEYIIAKQIYRSATSIGANINEANYGVSKADFIAKMQIALKETAETEYWLCLLILSENLEENIGKPLLSDCLEIKRLLISSLNTAKTNFAASKID